MDGPEKRRATAEVTLRSTPGGEPGAFETRWRAETWTGVSADSFDSSGGWPLAWELPSPEALIETMTALLQHAWTAIAQASED